MTNDTRRGFFGKLLAGAIFAPSVAKAVIANKLEPKIGHCTGTSAVSTCTGMSATDPFHDTDAKRYPPVAPALAATCLGVSALDEPTAPPKNNPRLSKKDKKIKKREKSRAKKGAE